MRTIYIADDGKQFEDEYECERYENELRIASIGESFVAYDDKMNKISNENLINMADCFYLVKFDEDGADILYWIYEETGYCYLEELYKRKPGSYIIDPEDDENWLSKKQVERIVRKLNVALEVM